MRVSTDSVHFICVDRPLAYLITFSCYGSHLHGAEDGSVDRDHNLKGGRYLAPAAGLLRAREERMRGPSYALRAVRHVVEKQGEPMAVYLNTAP